MKQKEPLYVQLENSVYVISHEGWCMYCLERVLSKAGGHSALQAHGARLVMRIDRAMATELTPTEADHELVREQPGYAAGHEAGKAGEPRKGPLSYAPKPEDEQVRDFIRHYRTPKQVAALCGEAVDGEKNQATERFSQVTCRKCRMLL